MGKAKSGVFVKFLVDFFVLSFFFAIGVSFYRYYHQKDYDYLVESSCDPIAEHCFSRDCENSADCPPNQLSAYKEYYVKAYDFPRCEDNSCAIACGMNSIKCEAVLCDTEAGDTCLGPTSE